VSQEEAKSKTVEISTKRERQQETFPETTGCALKSTSTPAKSGMVVEKHQQQRKGASGGEAVEASDKKDFILLRRT
jgi:hypothetical protein